MLLSLIADWLMVQATWGPYIALDSSFGVVSKAAQYLQSAHGWKVSSGDIYDALNGYVYLPLQLLYKLGYRTEMGHVVTSWMEIGGWILVIRARLRRKSK